MRIVLVDGNNVIHKIQGLKKIFSDNPEAAQLSLYESIKGKISKNDKLMLFFDGFSTIKSPNIIFSGNKTADEIIRKYIEENYSKKKISVISSDAEILGLAKVCGCEILKSEDYVTQKQFDAKSNINHYFKEENEKPDRMSKKDFDFFKNQFS